jgi:hypothetical protein
MKTWSPLQNPFLSATEKSFLNAMGISTYHDSALSASKSDPFFLGLYNFYHPIHLSYKTAYDNWIQQGGKQQGDTLNLTQLLRLLSNTKIRQWDIKIQNQYAINTPAYTRLLPDRRKPFQSGSQIERIQAVQVLSQAIDTDESLATVKTDVDNFNTLIQSALLAQKESKTNTRNESSNVDMARVAMCNAQYSNLGAMIQKFYETPEKAEAYFDLVAIRRSQQTVFTGHVKAGGVYTILRHTFDDTDEITLTNPGNVPLKFYLAPFKDSQPNGIFVTLGTGNKTVLANELGNLNDTCLMVLNTDPLHIGEFMVELD